MNDKEEEKIYVNCPNCAHDTLCHISKDSWRQNQLEDAKINKWLDKEMWTCLICGITIWANADQFKPCTECGGDMVHYHKYDYFGWRCYKCGKEKIYYYP